MDFGLFLRREGLKMPRLRQFRCERPEHSSAIGAASRDVRQRYEAIDIDAIARRISCADRLKFKIQIVTCTEGQRNLQIESRKRHDMYYERRRAHQWRRCILRNNLGNSVESEIPHSLGKMWGTHKQPPKLINVRFIFTRR